MWVLLGVFVLLGGQPSEAGTGDHTQQTDRLGHDRARDYDEYVAIGDSFTAGSGIRPDDGSGCLRSGRDYPSRLAERLGARLYDASCGGSTTQQLETPQPTAGSTNPPQITEVDRRTDLVTISLGLNDTRFATVLRTCQEVAWDDPQGSPCRTALETRGDSILATLPEFGQRLERVIRTVRRHGPNAEVVVVGYPQLAPESGTCADLPFAAGDYAYLAQYLVALNSVIEAAAYRAGVHFADVLTASSGHDICAGGDAWVLGARPSPRTIVFHPFANEQRAIAALVEDVLQSEAGNR